MTLIAGAALTVAVQVMPAAPAFGSCALPPRVSAHPFTGTVIGLSNTGRTASVRTDDGRVVTVRGSEADEPNAATTVDRSYQMGVRYEFHPINDADPYQDNSCTATHPVAAVRTKPASPASPAAVGRGSGIGSNVALALGGIGGAGIAAMIGAWLLFRRRARPAP